MAFRSSLLKHTKNHFHHSQIRYLSTQQPSDTSKLPTTPPTTHTTFTDKLISKYGSETIIAPSDYNRLKVVPYAILSNVCMGALYAWSIFNDPLTKELGVLTASSLDWKLSNVTPVFSMLVFGGGVAMCLNSKYIEKLGPKISGIVGGTLFGGGMILGGAGVYLHSLPLLYIGWGIAGIGFGWGYLPPIALLIRWFPDKKGLATGLAVSGFGGGALLIVRLKKYLLQKYQILPEYIGTLSENITKRDESGKLLCDINKDGTLFKEVINVTKNDISTLSNIDATTLESIKEGLYIVGTGNTGVTTTMSGLGAIYLTSMLYCAFKYREPPKKQVTTDNKTPSNTETEYVSIDNVMKTPQFWLCGLTLSCTATAGMGLVSCAKDVIISCYGSALFAATFVQILSLANVSGRVIWSGLSDKIGRKNTFTLFTCVGAPLYLLIPYIVDMGNQGMIMFYGSTMLIISFFGAGYAVMPAYEADLFGSKNVGAIHGRIMLATSIGGVFGPLIYSKVFEYKKVNEIKNLIECCDVNKFIDKYGCSIDKVDNLIASNAIKIKDLLEICPSGITDPTPHLYDPAFHAMAGVFAIGALSNFAIKSVDKKYFTKC